MISLLHHGAAASSSSHSLVWITNPDSSTSIVYASHGIINICSRTCCTATREPLWTVQQTLRTMTAKNNEDKCITTLAALHNDTALACGFSDGTVTLWVRVLANNSKDIWTEQVCIVPTKERLPAITAIDGISLKKDHVVLVTCSHDGVQILQLYLLSTTTTTTTITTTVLATYAANTIHIKYFPDIDLIILLVGTAAPRYNKIHVYTSVPITPDSTIGMTTVQFQQTGQLLGHEDWITDFSWDGTLLASASQDCRIRLWNFATTLGDFQCHENDTDIDTTTDMDDDDDVEPNDDEEDIGEARLEIHHTRGITRVTLDALLYGHEEGVTSVKWHPNPALYHQDRILVTSSMDRTLLLWACQPVIWTPLARVGSAGGILGGSIGSTLLGYVHVAVEPMNGMSLLGQAYGGALHMWSLEYLKDTVTSQQEDALLQNKWKATPCVTGHFHAVTDLVWEASKGEYLLTVSKDQTCRLWAPINTVSSSSDETTCAWVELARPQVHGYDLTTITSISTPEHRHLIVTGADEKEARAFDAPLTTTKLLQSILGLDREPSDGMVRVERAYIPSLGLSNKASADDGAEEDLGIIEDDINVEQIKLPLERDLGAISLWPEVRKLYGHNTELVCMTSSLTAQSGTVFEDSYKEILVASSAKARDVQDASIRIWNIEEGKCIQTLDGGHKSSVVTLAFSPDGKYLASSGKDRRLCIWKRQSKIKTVSFFLATAVDSAHKRILWSVHFCPLDPTLLVSGSRDGSVKLWRVVETCNVTEVQLLSSFESSSRSNAKAESVTALAFCPVRTTTGNTILAVGLECGLMELWGVSKDGKTCKLVQAFDSQVCHIATITKLAWRPKSEGKQILASCSLDHGCRLFEIQLD